MLCYSQQVRVARSAHVRFEDCVAVKNSAGTGGGGFLSWVGFLLLVILQENTEMCCCDKAIGVNQTFVDTYILYQCIPYISYKSEYSILVYD